MQEFPKILVISGPTACGKSALAHSICKKFSGEIINADSVQVYKDFNIASAKPDSHLLAEVPYHLLSELDPSDDFNAGRFETKASAIISDIVKRKALPVVVGGTGLYIRALLSGLIEAPEAEVIIKEQLKNLEKQQQAEGKSREEIANFFYKMLCELDPQTADELSCGDFQRITRALVVKLQTGSSMQELMTEHAGGKSDRYNAIVVCLMPPRDKLYEAIEKRVQLMLKQGLVDEVRELLLKYDVSCKPFQAIGYKEVVDFLSANASYSKTSFGAASYEDMVRRITINTRRFAKRQVTWWRHQPEKLKWTMLPALKSNAQSSSQLSSEIMQSVTGIWGKITGSASFPQTSYLPVIIDRLVD